MILELNSYERFKLPFLFPQASNLEEGIACNEMREIVQLTSEDRQEGLYETNTEGGVNFNKLNERKGFEFNLFQVRVLIAGVKQHDKAKTIQTDHHVVKLAQRILAVEEKLP